MFFDVSFALQLDGFELHLTFLNLILHLVMNDVNRQQKVD